MTARSEKTAVDGEADLVALAMERVLAAEVEGASRVTGCRQSAADSIKAARTDASLIAQRTDDRISRLHAAYMARITQQEQELAEPQSPARQADQSETADRVSRAIERLAIEITS